MGMNVKGGVRTRSSEEKRSRDWGPMYWDDNLHQGSANHGPIWPILAHCTVLYGPWHNWIWLALWAMEMNWCFPALCLPPLPVPIHSAWWPYFTAAQDSCLANAGYLVVESPLASCPNWNGWAFQGEGVFWDPGHWRRGWNWLWWES